MFARAATLVRTDYGREPGWTVELEGRVVGELRDPRFEEMFWYSYALHARDSEGGEILADDMLWIADGAFVGGKPPFIRDGRVLMRGLYLLPRGILESTASRLFESILPRLAGAK